MRIISHAETPSEARDEIVTELRRVAAKLRETGNLQATKGVARYYHGQAECLFSQANFFSGIIFQPKMI